MTLCMTSTTQSDRLFAQAFGLAVGGKTAESEVALELGHEMREMELRLARIALNAPSDLALLLVKDVMTVLLDSDDQAQPMERPS